MSGCLAVTVLLSLAFVLPPAGALARNATGALSLRAVGLPRGEHAVVTLEGPRPGGHGRSRRHVSIAATRTLRRLPPGRYRLSVSRVKIRHRHQTIKPGSVAIPVARHLSVRVRPGRAAKVDVRYGSIINPGVHSASGEIVSVVGDPAAPSQVLLRHGHGVHPGTILSARPSPELPQGLLAKVTAVSRRHGLTVATVVPAGIYEVAPNMSFDLPLSSLVSGSARASSVLQCGPTGSTFSPFVKISNVYLTGGWTTTHVLFADITNGAVIELHLKAGAGLDVSAGAGFKCSIPLPALAVQGMAGPIPVYGGIRPSAEGEVAAQGKLHTEGSTNITLGTSISIPGGAKPVLNFGSPSFTFSSDLFTGVKAGIGLSAELGIGAANAANLHLSVANDLDFTASPGQCSWDLNLGSFGVGGQIGPVRIVGPSSPPLFHRNLWHRSCGAGSSPAPPPPPTGPLTRATMSWDTDSDIDLYTWDGAGDTTFYGEKTAIPDAELVEDIIPAEGEFQHSPELFVETGSFNRPYTFGICDYRGEGADVTLTVVDPGGGSRTFHETLYFEGDSAVITSSPLGVDYSPPWEWCHYAEEPSF